MNNKQVAHLWANKSRSEAKGSHFYFEGDTIYSYGPHFPIARHYKGAVLFTSRHYSNTTAGHISIVRCAASHLESFTVCNVSQSPCGDDVKQYADNLTALATHASRARDPQWLLESLQRATDEANRFCAKFGFKTRFAMPDDDTLATLRAKSKAEQARKAKQTAERNARIERENRESIKQWLAGEMVSLPYTINAAYLRARPFVGDCPSTDGAMMMETSKGARVPLSDAERAFKFVIKHRNTGWRRNGDTFKIGEFHLDSVNDQGVIAGCHRVTWEEIERFAKSQNWVA